MANYIYEDKIAMLSLEQKEAIGIIIESKEIAETQKSLFNLLWISLNNPNAPRN